jgi:hypothetical protein
MKDAEIQERIAALDALVSREGALVRLDQYGGGPDESRITANKAGYLRLGIEILKGAYLAYEREPQVPIDIGYLTADDSTVAFDWFERTETLTPLPDCGSPDNERTAKIMITFVIAVVGICITLALVGVVAIARWLLA